MEKAPFYTYEEETGCATCILEIDGMSFVGVARCHPEDMDMRNHTTGEWIAYMRAAKKAIQHEIYIAKIKLKAVEDCYSNMISSPKFNKKSYEARMMRKKIYFLREELEDFKHSKRVVEENINDFIKEKDKFYTQLRRLRAKDKKD